MPSPETQLIDRLFEADNPRDVKDWPKRDDYYVKACRVSPEDVPGLIDLARKWNDATWPDDDSGLDFDDESAQLLPVTAWRTLGDLKAETAVQPLIDILCASNEEYDDWAAEELPNVFGKIGEASLLPLLQLATDDTKPEPIRSIAVRGLQAVAEYHAQTRDRIVARLTEMMTSALPGQIEFNTSLLSALVDLQAVEAAEPLERAFAADLVDVGMLGDWEDVRKMLGVEGLGLKMPEHPHNSMEQFRLNVGVGIFSDAPLFLMGEAQEDALEAYYKRAWDTFSKSSEAQQAIERFGDLRWHSSLLEFGINYLGESVDAMTCDSVQAFVLDYVPRKVSTEASAAASIVGELTGFWQYVDRVYKLPEAKAIVAWLQTDGLVHRLEAELSDSSNFGMAKSFVMQGQQAGYDMTTQEGAKKFMAAYNASLSPSVLPAPFESRKNRVGRNDPCPCGSGKKFKKCCGRAG
jgi:hypothetical protein